MKTFAYTTKRENNDRNGNPKQYFTVYQIKNNTPECLVRDKFFSYESPKQAVSDWLYENKLIPRKAHAPYGVNWKIIKKTHRLIEM